MVSFPRKGESRNPKAGFRIKSGMTTIKINTFRKCANIYDTLYRTDFLQDPGVLCGKLLRVAPEDTPRGTDRKTRGDLAPSPFFNTEVALRSLCEFPVKLHDIIGTGLHTAAPAGNTPSPLLDRHCFRQSLFHFTEGL